MFRRKSPEWSYEKEWRVIRPLEEAVEVIPREGLEPICLFDVPIDAFKMVITGAKMPPEECEVICNYFVGTEVAKHISIHHMQLSKEHYSLDTEPALTEEERQQQRNGKVCIAKPFGI